MYFFFGINGIAPAVLKMSENYIEYIHNSLHRNSRSNWTENIHYYMIDTRKILQSRGYNNFIKVTLTNSQLRHSELFVYCLCLLNRRCITTFALTKRRRHLKETNRRLIFTGDVKQFIDDIFVKNVDSIHELLPKNFTIDVDNLVQKINKSTASFSYNKFLKYRDNLITTETLKKLCGQVIEMTTTKTLPAPRFEITLSDVLTLQSFF